MIHFRQQFPGSRQLATLANECLDLLEADCTKNSVPFTLFGCASVDSDSGTYSGAEEDAMTSSNNGLCDTDAEFVKILNSDNIKDYRQQLIELFMNIAKDLSNEGEAKLKQLENLMNGKANYRQIFK